MAPKKGVLYPSPSLAVSSSPNASTWNQGFHDVYKTLLRNLKKPIGPITTRYAQPSPIYAGAYLWDTAFIALVWKPWEIETAAEVDEAVWRHAADDGRLKHFVSAFDKSDWTQPPLMAWSVWKLYQWSGDREILAEAYPALAEYNAWLYANRRLPGGLFFWLHSYESGIDNSPRFTSADEYDMKDLTRLAAIDLNSQMVRQNQVLAQMARVLGLPADQARYEKQAAKLAELINRKMWDSETGYYYDLDMDTGELLKIRTIASMFPLFAGIPSQERAARMRDQVMDPDRINTYFPLPSVARDEPSFEKDCWRGPVWINTAYLVVLGLERYGYKKEASDLAYRLAGGVYRNYQVTGEFVEFYDPDHDGERDLHRKRGNLYKRLTLGDKPRPNFVGWTGLCNTMVIENLAGYRREEGKVWLAPQFPSQAAGMRLELDMPSVETRIKMTVREDGGAEGSVASPAGVREFSLAPGEKMILK